MIVIVLVYVLIMAIANVVPHYVLALALCRTTILFDTLKIILIILSTHHNCLKSMLILFKLNWNGAQSHTYKKKRKKTNDKLERNSHCVDYVRLIDFSLFCLCLHHHWKFTLNFSFSNEKKKKNIG